MLLFSNEAGIKVNSFSNLVFIGYAESPIKQGGISLPNILCLYNKFYSVICLAICQRISYNSCIMHTSWPFMKNIIMIYYCLNYHGVPSYCNDRMAQRCRYWNMVIIYSTGALRKPKDSPVGKLVCICNSLVVEVQSSD